MKISGVILPGVCACLKRFRQAQAPLFFILALLLTNTVVFAGEPPEVEAIGAILIDGRTGRVLWGKNAEKPLPMASTTKIMTAVITLERGNLDDEVTASARAAAAPEVNMNLRRGEKIKLRDLLYALMLQSSNDAAVAIAEHIGGDVETFCAMMTEKARELGSDASFFTPNGLDAPGHEASARDMAIIARYALQNRKFLEIIGTRTYSSKSSLTERFLVNKNRLLSEYDGAIGVKTGFTGKAGNCFVGAAERGDKRLISVVLGSGWGPRGREQKWRDTKAILNYGFKNFEYADILEKGRLAGKTGVSRSRARTVYFAPGDGVTLPLSPEERAACRVDFIYPETLRAPVRDGDRVGKAVVRVNGVKEAEAGLYAITGAERHDLKTSAEKVLEAFFGMGTKGEVEVVLPEF
ncbi:MAG: D-alanyl-D-alanine carboxypeptidase [Clostridiales bacterium]|jgi:D-alanyl-D-alanine carboxypeptidase (penicillin-binding protein 5/6)|nr:D-alanyl-D-alanine carboxypeptidase [Clostridiales bacterium]